MTPSVYPRSASSTTPTWFVSETGQGPPVPVQAFCVYPASSFYGPTLSMSRIPSNVFGPIPETF
jgi:hypothetical protein